MGEVFGDVLALDLEANFGPVSDHSPPGLQEMPGKLFSEPEPANTMIENFPATAQGGGVQRGRFSLLSMGPFVFMRRCDVKVWGIGQGSRIFLRLP